jgi:WD40 repeat protein
MTVTKKVVANLIKNVKFAQINCLHFTKNGHKLLAGDDGGYVYVWKTDILYNKYSLEANLRISERGIVSIKWLPYADYETNGYFLALIKEGPLLLLQHSFSTVYTK